MAFRVKVGIFKLLVRNTKKPRCLFPFQYYVKTNTKTFKGNDTTKAAIEGSKRSKGGKRRYLVLDEKTVKILKRDAKVSSYETIEILKKRKLILCSN